MKRISALIWVIVVGIVSYARMQYVYANEAPTVTIDIRNLRGEYIDEINFGEEFEVLVSGIHRMDWR